MSIDFPDRMQVLFQPARYKVFYGGRGAGRSWSCARALLLLGTQRKMRVLCARETQMSIADSVHKLLSEQIEILHLRPYYKVQRTRIIGRNGTEFLFKGIRRNPLEIKSLEGIDYCWVEEAQTVSETSWNILIPTIRKRNSEIWVTFNTGEATDPTYRRFVTEAPPEAFVQLLTWRDNPWVPQVLLDEKDYLKRVDYDAYMHVWEGIPLEISDAVIFRNKYVVESFVTPPDIRLFFGVDWGFSQDPTVLIRAFVKDNNLFVDYEASGLGVDIDKLPALFNQVPESRMWPIFADAARPETVSYVRRAGFNISAAPKWTGCVEDGIAFLRSFENIVIHPRCKRLVEEAGLYRYKVDPNTNAILTQIVDANNHAWDALRYAFYPQIKHRGVSKAVSGGHRIAPHLFEGGGMK